MSEHNTFWSTGVSSMNALRSCDVPLGRVLLQVILVLSLVFCWTSIGRAQTATGSITGTVRDPSGAVVPGVEVKLINTDTNEQRNTTSNELGYYSFPLLAPGTYRIEAKATGFKAFVRENIKLDVAMVAPIDITLEVGAATQTITVTSEAPLLESGSSSLGHLIESTRITELPLNGRNAYGFATLVPGVRASRGFTQVAYTMYADQFVSINGSRPNQNVFYLDGGSNTTAGFNGPGFFPSPDMVAEYKVQTNNYSAQFGETTGGVVNVVTKTGSNKFHGSLFEFLRHDKLTANDFFINKAGKKEGPFRFNQFGGTLGGPIWKDHTFFFFSYEGLRWSRALTINGTLPTQLQRSGDFSQTFSSGGKLITVYDPVTSRPDPARPGKFVRSPFPGNVIPPNRLDAVARNLIDLTPLPNTAGHPVTNVNNYLLSSAAPINRDQYSGRLDHSITQNQKVFFRLSWNDTTRERPPFYGEKFKLSQPNAGTDTLIQRQATLNYTNVLSPTVILEASSSFLRYWIGRDSPALGYDSVQLGFPESLRSIPLEPCFPRISVSGMGVSTNVADTGGGFLGNCAYLGNSFDTFQDTANLTVVRGSHTLKTGFSFTAKRWSARNFLTTSPSYSFGAGFTQGPDPLKASSTAGVGYASFLLGIGGGSIRSGGLSQNNQTVYYGFYFQDDWKITPKLTLNLGVRYDNPRPWTERFNRVTGWCYDCSVPLEVPGMQLRGGLQFPGVDGRSRNLYDPDNNNIAPRFGFAYALNDKTVIRGGYGIFYGPVQGGAVNGTSTPRSGFEARTSWVSSIDGITPVNYLSNPYPDGFEPAPGSSMGTLTLLGQSVVGMDADRETPYSQQWNFNIQRTLPANFILDVAYAGSRGIHLFGPLILNQLPNEFLSMGDDLRTLVPNPFFGLIKTGSLSNPQIQQGQLLRPYPQFNQVTAGNSSYGASTYHALQAKLERRFSGGLSLLFSYTFSKLLDDVRGSTAGGGFPGESFPSGVLLDYQDRSHQRAPAQFDTPHLFSFNGIWELPFGPGKRYLNQQRLLGAILGGWQLNSIVTLQSGVPLALRTRSNTLRNYGGRQTPNWNGTDPHVDGPISQRLDHYFNTDAFTSPPPYTYGNVARLVGWLRAPGLANLDLSVVKNIPIPVREGWRLQFRFETFNTFNHPQFSAPNTSIGSPNAGVITRQANMPRDIQFGLKLLF